MSTKHSIRDKHKLPRSDVYHQLFQRGLELVEQNKLPDRIILDILKEYTAKLEFSNGKNVDPGFLEAQNPLILLAVQENLLTENQELIDVNEGYEEVLNLLTHEFKNLLTTVRGYNEILESKLKSENEQELLNLHNASDHVIKKLFAMTDAILKMSLTEKGLLTPDYRLLDLEDNILQPLEAELQEEFNRKNMRIHKRNQAKKTMLVADEQLLEIIVRNLLENAVKYGDPNSTIDIWLDSNKEHVVLTIKNACTHLPEGICDTIFEKFKTVKLSNIQRGTGIGLYNVKNLVRVHHGNITCSSSAHKWIKFRVTLPFEARCESEG